VIKHPPDWPSVELPFLPGAIAAHVALAAAFGGSNFGIKIRIVGSPTVNPVAVLVQCLREIVVNWSCVVNRVLIQLVVI
jgi:hypothetical protein